MGRPPKKQKQKESIESEINSNEIQNKITMDEKDINKNSKQDINKLLTQDNSKNNEESGSQDLNINIILPVKIKKKEEENQR